MTLRCENTPLYKFIRSVKMEQLFIRQEMIDIISKSHKEFNTNLKNKKVMFVFESQDRKIKKEEMFFPISSFYHLTGIKAYDLEGKELSSYNFYNLLHKNRIDQKINDFSKERN